MSEETVTETVAEETAAEVVEETVEVDDRLVVEFDGQEFRVAKGALDDVEVLEHWEDGKHTLLLRAILGQQQWNLFKQKKRGLAEIYKLLDLLVKALEVE